MPLEPFVLTNTTFSARTVVIGVLILALFVGLFGYIAFQARLLIQGPSITLINEPAAVHNQRIITLEGTAKNITRITLNGRQIFTDEYGYFQEALVLENGYTIATIAASDRYGRTTEVVRSFVFTPASIITE